jgi:hypothetical protein
LHSEDSFMTYSVIGGKRTKTQVEVEKLEHKNSSLKHRLDQLQDVGYVYKLHEKVNDDT